ncbi:MAG: acetolactate decarboxylase [Anaerolinea sp.]|nr:acetolactate decarboxylase [Anaerolinea sp.]
MTATRSALLVYNTVDRLLRGDLYHTVTTADVLGDLAVYPKSFPVVGIGTTNWLHRNGEVIVHGTAEVPAFLWADPASDPVGAIIDLTRQQPSPQGTPLVTPRLDADDQEANFPFLALAVCDPAKVMKVEITDVPNVYDWLVAELQRLNVGVAGVSIHGQFGMVETTDAYNMPLGGVDLKEGYTNEQVFRFARYAPDSWALKGVYAANPSLQPFISVSGRPLHLHGYRLEDRHGGHIVNAPVVHATVSVYPVDDLILRIHDVARAYMPRKLGYNTGGS